MKKYLDGWDFAAHIRFVRQVHKGCIFIVEGENDDRVVSSFINEALCTVEISFGKSNAVEALDLLEDEAFPGVVALVDADFDRIHGIDHGLQNLVMTDGHDMDLTIMASDALEKYLSKVAEAEKLQKFGADSTTLVRETIYNSASPVACCRYLSDRETFMLAFRRLGFDFIEEATLNCDVNHMIDDIMVLSPAARCSAAELKNRLSAFRISEYDLYQLLNGHDTATILGVALRKILGSLDRSETYGAKIEGALRDLFEPYMFYATKMFLMLRDWEQENPRYKIFAT